MAAESDQGGISDDRDGQLKKWLSLCCGSDIRQEMSAPMKARCSTASDSTSSPTKPPLLKCDETQRQGEKKKTKLCVKLPKVRRTGPWIAKKYAVVILKTPKKV